MGTIHVCDYPECNEALPDLHDRLELRFAPFELDARLEAMRARGSIREAIASGEPLSVQDDLVEPDPDPIRKDLCREHARQVRFQVAMIFQEA